MINQDSLLELMDMPDPYFPIKVHRCSAKEYGAVIFPNHWHKHIEILLFMSGKALVECNSIPNTVEAGELVIVNSNDLHAGISLAENLSYYALIFDPSLLQSQSLDAIETKFIAPIIQNSILFDNKIAINSGLEGCFLSIVKELDDHAIGYELSIKSHLFQMLTILTRHHVAQMLPVNDQKTRLKNLERFAPILHYIETHYQEELSVEMLAQKVGLSRFHFSRLFKNLTGKAITEYINGIRVNRAEYLLRNTTMTVSEVALSTGFHDIYYFSRIFKKITKVPPSRIQKSD
mgnify:CR=1 FL=1